MATSIIPRTSGVYKITCTTNNKIYIGSAVNLHRRWLGHQRDLRASKHCNFHLQAAWNKYGADAFVFAVIEECDREQLMEREQFYLDTLRPYERSIGFNLGIDARSGMAGRTFTPEVRAKMSASRKGKKRDKPFTEEQRARMSEAAKSRPKPTPERMEKLHSGNRGRKMLPQTKEALRVANVGRKMLPEDVEKMRVAITGRKLSPEHCAKISAAQKGKPGKPHTLESKSKLSAAHKGKKASPELRAKLSVMRSGKSTRKFIYTINAPDGTQTTTDNMQRFCQENNLYYKAMSQVASGKLTHYKGWTAQRKRIGQ